MRSSESPAELQASLSRRHAVDRVAFVAVGEIRAFAALGEQHWMRTERPRQQKAPFIADCWQAQIPATRLPVLWCSSGLAGFSWQAQNSRSSTNLDRGKNGRHEARTFSPRLL